MVRFLQGTLWVTGAFTLVLGLLLWTGRAVVLTNLHMVLGIIVILALWTLAAIALRHGTQGGLAIMALVWGLLTPVVGVFQVRLLPGDAHIIIQLVHLVLGAGALALGNRLASKPQNVYTHKPVKS